MSIEQMAILDLGRYQPKGVRVFAGRPRGAQARKEAGLDQLDVSPEQVEVRVPEETFAVNSSFFLAMFGHSIRQLGAEGFRGKYHFTGKDISETLESGIKDALFLGQSL